MLKKIVYAGGNHPSFTAGSKALRNLAEATVDAKQVERLTERIGTERQDERDAAVAAYLARPLAQREDPPPDAPPPPPLAVVEMDGGRLQIRAAKDESDEAAQARTAASAEQPAAAPSPRTNEPIATATAIEPDETAQACAAASAEQPAAAPSPRTNEPIAATTAVGPNKAAEACAAASAEQPATAPPRTNDPITCATAVAPNSEADRPAKSKHWREDKVGCLLAMKSEVSDVDPCPEIPSVFIDPLYSLKLAQEIGHCTVPKGTPFHSAEPEIENAAEGEPPKRPGRPEIETRRVVASRKDVHAFGPLLAAAAWSMGLFSAVRRAFVADGLAENWSVHKRYFPRWTAVLDFVHALTYVYAAAMAGRTFAEGWPVYERWIRWVWAGQVGKVIEELKERQQELGKPTKQDKEGSPPKVAQDTLTYLSNHQDKMHYDEYRKQGLPLMSSHVESTVKQINYRVKGTEKFWTEEGAEALLQLRADYISDDEPLEGFWERRQAAATGQRPYRRHSA